MVSPRRWEIQYMPFVSPLHPTVQAKSILFNDPPPKKRKRNKLCTYINLIIYPRITKQVLKLASGVVVTIPAL